MMTPAEIVPLLRALIAKYIEPISNKKINTVLPKNIHSDLIRLVLVRYSRSLITFPNLSTSLGNEANVRILKLLVMVSDSSPVNFESCIFALISYAVFRLKNKYCNKVNITMKAINTTHIRISFLATTITINGINIRILRILKIKLSTIFSYEYTNLFIFFTNAPEKLLVKNLNECLCKHWNPWPKIFFITFGSKVTKPNHTILHHQIDHISMIAILTNIPISIENSSILVPPLCTTSIILV